MMRDAVLHDYFARPGRLAVSAALRREIHDHRARRHARHHVRGHQQRCFLARDHRRGDHHIAFRDHLAQQLALPPVEVSRPARVAYPRASCASLASICNSTKRPPRLCTCSFTAGRKSYAETTAPSRRAVAIACSPATPAPDHSTRAGVIVPAAVVIIGKILGSLSAAIITALYPAHRGHRGKRIHALRARRARHQLHGKRNHSRSRRFPECVFSPPSGRKNPTRIDRGATKGGRRLPVLSFEP